MAEATSSWERHASATKPENALAQTKCVMAVPQICYLDLGKPRPAKRKAVEAP